jgi:hypothetical protein
MKKKWIGILGLISFLFLLSVNLFSNIGVKTGLNLSLAGQSEILYSPSELSGLKAGIFYTIQIGEYFSIQPEISYVKKGNKYYCTFCEGIRIANLDYLEIPIVINLHLLNKTLDLFSGVYVGILLDSIKNKIHSWEGRDIIISNTDYGVSFGARYRFFEFIFVELQFNQGLIAVIEEANQAVIKGHKNKTLSFLIGFGF